MDAKTQNKVLVSGLFGVGISPQLFNGFYNPFLSAYPAYFWAVDILTLVALPLSLYLWGLNKKIFTNRDLGLHFDFQGRRHTGIFITAMIGLPFLVYYGFWFFMWLGSYLHFYLFPAEFDHFTFDFSMALGGEGFTRVVQVIYFSVTAGLVEEFYYRGLFKLLFKPDRMGMVLFALLSALIFSLIHWEGGYVKMFTTFFLGLMFAGAYLFTKNLWPLIFGHFVADFFLFYGAP